MNLALFDFDGTLTTKDSLVDFLQYVVGKPRYYFYLFLLSPILILYKFGAIKNNTAKQKMISFFLKNRKEEEFKQIAKNYSLNSIEKIINEDTYKELSKHLHSGSRVVVVSASMECWLKPWCDQQNIELISTRLEFKNNRVSGKFSTKNCHGKEKVERIKKDIKLEDYKEIYAYGDSNGDKPMLDLATHAFWITR